MGCPEDASCVGRRLDARGARHSSRGMVDAPLSRPRLLAEFAVFFLAVPVAIAVALPPALLLPAALSLTALGLVLLARTPGFAWHDLTHGWRRIAWARVAAMALVTAAVGLGLMLALRPWAIFEPGRSVPLLLLAILVLYPPLSALPQEVLFRPLFFRRYGALLPRDARAQVVLNAAVFSLAHLVYWSWVVALLTFAGGVAFAHAYRVRRSFPEAVALHAVAGCVLFTLGLGTWFYAGNAERPAILGGTSAAWDIASGSP